MVHVYQKAGAGQLLLQVEMMGSMVVELKVQSTMISLRVAIRFWWVKTTTLQPSCLLVVHQLLYMVVLHHCITHDGCMG